MEEKLTKTSPGGGRNATLPEKEVKTFSILGCCVSRDLFEIGDTQKVIHNMKINSFWSLSPVSAFSNKIPKLQNVSIDDLEWGRNWQKKCVVVDIEKTYLEKSDFSSDYILVDLAHTRIELASFEKHNSYFTANLPFKNNSNILKNIINEKLIYYTALDLPENTILENIKIFAQKLKQKAPTQKIIFIEIDLAFDYFDKNGFISQFANQNKIKKENELLKKACDCFLKEIPNCHIIKMPNNVLAYELHKWGLLNLHYCNEFYDYLIKAIDVICCNYSIEKEKLELEHLKSVCERIFTDRRRIIELKTLVHKQMEQKQQLNSQINTLNSKIKSLEQNNSNLNISLQNQIKDYQELNKQITNIKSSKTYKIGSAITYIPRKIFKRKRPSN